MSLGGDLRMGINIQNRWLKPMILGCRNEDWAKRDHELRELPKPEGFPG